MEYKLSTSDLFAGHELAIDIQHIEKDPRRDAIAIYAIIENKADTPIDIKLFKSYVISTNRIQHEAHSFDGFFNTIAPKAFKIQGEIHDCSSGIGNFQSGWIYGVQVLDNRTGKIYQISFRLQSMQRWEVISCNISEGSSKKIKDLLNNIERIEAFEDKMGVRIENLSLSYEGSGAFDVSAILNLYFDVFEKEPGSVTSSFFCNAVLYDKDNSIITKCSEYINHDRFMGYDTIRMCLGCLSGAQFLKINRIRLYISK